MARSRRGADPITEQVDTGVAELRPDVDRPRAYTLLLDQAPQSHVDLDDPTYLDFEYVRRFAIAVDLAAPPGEPLRVLHLGGGALTLPRYVSATRPGSTQRVVEVDGALVELVRRELPWARDPRLKVRVGEAREVLRSLPDAAYDLIVGDVFAGARTPAHLSSVEFAHEVARVLAPAGQYLVNMADGPPLAYARSLAATVRAALPRTCLIADSGVLSGRRYGNLVLVASRVDLPIPQLSRRVVGDWFPGRVLHDAELRRFTSGAPVRDDASARPSNPPPSLTFGSTH
ncbi:spermidine synthase [Phytohabitans aurantiacus]|uniref:PABS domain-containing protein n=1 Tax=Phytohabitans aurantiacus TaxID=3016789 RepID=A0ABQ5RA79_9ACTN|nr:fused MFS/spermidine synthase [Phytohabitans aurantiacus]GLI02802.1 hypothetical protein Pa4123_80800 [Phytohabitans aurantiacus]